MLLLDYLIFALFSLLVMLPLGLFISDQLSIRMTTLERVSLGMNLGLAFLVVIIFILWRLNLYQITGLIFLLPVYYLLFLLRKKTPTLPGMKNLKQLVIPFICFLTVLIIGGLVTVPFGEDRQGGLSLPNAHNFDTLSYLAITQGIEKNLPSKNLLYQGETINNYNYLTLILPASLDYVLKISPVTSMFKIVPVFLLLLFCISLYAFLLSLGINSTVASYGVLFVSLSSNLFYIIKFFYPNAYFNPSVMWVDEYTTRLVNPQLLFSYCVLLSLMLILNKNETLKWKDIIIVSVLGGSLIAIKAFAGIIYITALSLLAIWDSFKKKFDNLIAIVGMGMCSVIFYLLSNSKPQSSIFIFSPMWFIKNVYETTDHLNYVKWELKRETYLQDHNWLRIIQLYTEGVFWFIVINLGTRLVGLLSFVRLTGQRKRELLLLLTIGVLGIIAPLLVIVKGTAWNSIQFFYYAVLVFGILSVWLMDRIFKTNKVIALILALFLWLPLIPGVIFTTASYLNSNQQTVSKSVYDSLLFLKTQEQGLVLIDPQYNKNALVPAISGQPVFFADEMMLNVQLIDYQSRKNLVDELFSKDFVDRSRLIRQNGIKYIYSTSTDSPKFLGFQRIYQNEQIIIYKVNE